MQTIFVTRGGNDKKPENQKKFSQMIRAQEEAIHVAEKEGIPVIFIEYESSGKSLGTTNDDLLCAASGCKATPLFLKDSDGMFEDGNTHKKELVDYLKKNKIKTLILTGANGGACVKSSIESALENGFNVIAYEKAIADFNYQDFIYPYTGYTSVKSPKKDIYFKQVSEMKHLISLLPKDRIKSSSFKVCFKSGGIPTIPLYDEIMKPLGKKVFKDETTPGASKFFSK
jgi:nicotinamidase-related amidase